MYAFFVKGLYGIYLLINNFSFWGVVYIVFVLILSFDFMKYVLEFENVFKRLIKKKN